MTSNKKTICFSTCWARQAQQVEKAAVWKCLAFDSILEILLFVHLISNITLLTLRRWHRKTGNICNLLSTCPQQQKYACVCIYVSICVCVCVCVRGSDLCFCVCICGRNKANPPCVCVSESKYPKDEMHLLPGNSSSVCVCVCVCVCMCWCPLIISLFFLSNLPLVDLMKARSLGHDQ